MSNFNLDLAVEYVKNIIDKTKCITCDQLNRSYVRYPCGHSVCNSCVAVAEDCLLCFSPPPISTHVLDEPLSRRIENISNLLCTFQDLFNLNVYRQHRISKQLKLEKQVFPTCIQAPSKYCNKRKSLNASVQNKENLIPCLPGENISYPNAIEMENVIGNVRQWLNKNETNLKKCINLPRKPFTDLGVNVQNLNKHSSIGLSKDKYNKICKRIHNKKVSPKRKKLQLLKKGKRVLKHESIQNTIFIKSKNEIDESGIIMDDDTIVIDETQDENIDKDKCAWLAVLEAEKNNSYDITKINQANTNLISFDDVNKFTKPISAQSKLSSYKVPFYKKGILYETCNLCYKELIIKKYSESNKLFKENTKNVTVTIDSNDYVATIKISDCVTTTTRCLNKQSVKIQTDNDMKTDYLVTNDAYSKKVVDKPTSTQDIKENNDLLKASADIFDINVANKKFKEIIKNDNKYAKGLLIEETDSDSGNENDNTLEVTADVHRSESVYNIGVLSTLKQEQYVQRKRNAVRGRTPLSTDSSDKENYDPNRAKRQKFSKKCNKK